MSKDSPLHSKIRKAGLMERVFSRLRCPLASVPDCAHLTSFSENLRYGYMGVGYRAVAETLVQGVEYTVHADVPGEIAEFGCQTGRTATVLAAAMRYFRANNALHLFDSFEGLPESSHVADQENPHVKSGVWGSGELKAISPAELRAKCAKHLSEDRIFIYEGWFCNTLPKLPAGTRFAMLHIDCDLYASTIDVLDYVLRHRLVNPGALLCFDDWDCAAASNQHGERKAWREITEQYHVEAEDCGAYSWGCRKFIVHSYSGRTR